MNEPQQPTEEQLLEALKQIKTEDVVLQTVATLVNLAGQKLSVEGAKDPSNPFPEVATLLTVDEDFGGWDEVSTKFFDEENGLIFEAILGAGLSLE